MIICSGWSLYFTPSGNPTFKMLLRLIVVNVLVNMFNNVLSSHDNSYKLLHNRLLSLVFLKCFIIFLNIKST